MFPYICAYIRAHTSVELLEITSKSANATAHIHVHVYASVKAKSVHIWKQKCIHSRQGRAKTIHECVNMQANISSPVRLFFRICTSLCKQNRYTKRGLSIATRPVPNLLQSASPTPFHTGEQIIDQITNHNCNKVYQIMVHGLMAIHGVHADLQSAIARSSLSMLARGSYGESLIDNGKKSDDWMVSPMHHQYQQLD